MVSLGFWSSLTSLPNPCDPTYSSSLSCFHRSADSPTTALPWFVSLRLYVSISFSQVISLLSQSDQWPLPSGIDYLNPSMENSEPSLDKILLKSTGLTYVGVIMPRRREAHLRFILICISILLSSLHCEFVRAKEDLFIAVSHGWTDRGARTCHWRWVIWLKRRDEGKKPNEFFTWSPLELVSKNKAGCAAGCWLESDMKREERKKHEGRMREACRLGWTFRVDYGPIFNWQASVRLDDHQAGLAEMTRGQRRHATTWH